MSVRSISRFAAILPLMWYVAAPQLASYCLQDDAGNFPLSFVTNGDGKVVPWVNSPAQVKTCRVVSEYPL